MNKYYTVETGFEDLDDFENDFEEIGLDDLQDVFDVIDSWDLENDWDESEGY